MLDKLKSTHQAVMDVPVAHAINSPPFNIFMKVRQVEYTYDASTKTVVFICGQVVTVRLDDKSAEMRFDKGETPDSDELAYIQTLVTAIVDKLTEHGD